MNRTTILFLILIVGGVFVLGLQSIVKVKTVQLSFLLSRDQLFNYELSSKMLRTKFRTKFLNQEDYSREIKMNVLESGVLNFKDTDTFKLGPAEQIGLYIVNGVRMITLKTMLTLQEDQGRLLLLQYAFLLERTQNFEKAIAKYDKLDKSLKGSPQDHGFVLLHHGYCLALMGRIDEAIVKLVQVQELYPGTRNAEDAAILEAILRESKQKQQEIDRKYDTEEERAVALYKAGQYSVALEKFDKVKKLTVSHKYVRARSLENVGQKQRAIKEYIELVSQTKSNDIAIKANRRLLMISNFYQGGKELRKIAEQNAEKIGDVKALEEIKKGVDLQLKPAVIEKIKKQLESDEKKEEFDRQLIEQLEELRKDIEKTVEEEKKQIATLVKKAKPIQVRSIEKPVKQIKKDLARMEIHFIDGRKVFGKKIFSDGIFITIESGTFGITLPYSMFLRIAVEQKIENNSKKKKPFLKIVLKNRKVIKGLKLERINGEIVIERIGKALLKFPENQLKSAILIVK